MSEPAAKRQCTAPAVADKISAAIIELAPEEGQVRGSVFCVHGDRNVRRLLHALTGSEDPEALDKKIEKGEKLVVPASHELCQEFFPGGTPDTVSLHDVLNESPSDFCTLVADDNIGLFFRKFRLLEAGYLCTFRIPLQED